MIINVENISKRFIHLIARPYSFSHTNVGATTSNGRVASFLIRLDYKMVMPDWLAPPMLCDEWAPADLTYDLLPAFMENIEIVQDVSEKLGFLDVLMNQNGVNFKMNQFCV